MNNSVTWMAFMHFPFRDHGKPLFPMIKANMEISFKGYIIVVDHVP